MAVHKDVMRIVLEAGQVVQVAGVGESVDVDDGLIGLSQPVEYEVGADESGSPCYENGHFCFFNSCLVQSLFPKF